jgi:hypothetical protein
MAPCTELPAAAIPCHSSWVTTSLLHGPGIFTTLDDAHLARGLQISSTILNTASFGLITTASASLAVSDACAMEFNDHTGDVMR